MEFTEKKSYTLSICGQQIEVSQDIKEALETGKYMRVPSWYPHVYLRYDKDKDLWFSERVPDGVNLKTADKTDRRVLLEELQYLKDPRLKVLNKKSTLALLETIELVKQKEAL